MIYFFSVFKLFFMMLISSTVYADEEQEAYLYEKNKQALFLGGVIGGFFHLIVLIFLK